MTTRQALDDGRWFNQETARQFAEDTFFDGHNHVSRATGSQWDHETLYRTTGGKWILLRSSQRQGSRDSWTEITTIAAARWLVTNGHDESGVSETDAAMTALEVS